MKKKDVLIEYFWLFVVGSMIGCFYEMILEFFRNGTIGLHKGLLYGPFCQVYGIGLVIVVLLFQKIKNRVALLLGGFFAGGMIEYILSYVQEIVFHSKSWDYRNYPLNIEGRTSVFHMCFWALFVWLIMCYVYPYLHLWLNYFQTKVGRCITFACLFLLLADITVSVAATLRYRNRKEGIAANNIVETFLDRKYPDERIEAIYRMSMPVS